MTKKIEQLVEEQVGAWSGVAPPNAESPKLAQALAGVIEGFEKLRGQLRFEDEPSSFEAALHETKERNP